MLHIHIAIKPNTTVIENKFLKVILAIIHLGRLFWMIGIGVPDLGMRQIRVFNPIPLLPEQRAIVAKIEELFSDLDKGVADSKNKIN